MPSCFKKKTIKSIALAVLVSSLILAVHQLFLVKTIEENTSKRSYSELELSRYQTILEETEKGKFLCTPSGMFILEENVNDDFCDCPDGSDEPKTDACPDTEFRCEKGTGIIQSSRVNDGICDCCDGSDEWKSTPPLIIQSIEIQKKTQVFHPPCPNTC